jgi:ATP diphosphatase
LHHRPVLLDELAERVRKIGGVTPRSIGHASRLQSIEAKVVTGRPLRLAPQWPFRFGGCAFVPRPFMTPSRDISRLIEIMAALRTPGSGCPWDLEQTFATIAPYTLEEAFEVVDAIERGDIDDLREELGDLLLQVVFHARMAEEQKAFAFGDVVAAVTAKLIRRHPHVFSDEKARAAGEVKGLWDRIKAEEKAERAARRKDAPPESAGALAGIPVALPALARAQKLQDKASKVGFDWNDPMAVLAKIREEIGEVEEALAAGKTEDAAGEAGDLIFAMVNLVRHLGGDAEATLRQTNAKFERRFVSIEHALAKEDRKPTDATLAEMDALWDAAKRAETKTS